MIRWQTHDVSADLFDPMDSSKEQIATGMDGSNRGQRAGIAADGVSLEQPTRSQRIAFNLIAILLTSTALAKLWMLMTDPFADIRVGIPREILWLSVAFELWLAFENFRIRDHRVLTLVDTAVFSVFALFATTRWLLGYGSCGCSGNLELPAWIFILLDAAIVGWFTVRFSGRLTLSLGWTALRQKLSGWSPEIRGRMAGLGLFAGLILGIQLPLAAPLRAMVLGVPPVQATVKLDGDLVLEQRQTGRVIIVNDSLQAGRIVGISSSCRCFDLSEDPVSKSIPAHGRIEIPLWIKPNKPGRLHQRVELFLDHPKQFRVNVDVLGSVKGVGS